MGSLLQGTVDFILAIRTEIRVKRLLGKAARLEDRARMLRSEAGDILARECARSVGVDRGRFETKRR